jgi:ribosomal peptide maturation radical SAM protein 1
VSGLLSGNGFNSFSTEVLIVVPPFATISMPMLGPSILAAQCKEAGISTRIIYSNLCLANKVGPRLYEKISMSSFSLMVGELLFRRFAFDDNFAIDRSINDFFSSHKSLAVSGNAPIDISREEIEFVATEIREFLEEEVLRIAQLRPRIVGFSSVFQQNLACIAMARLLKRQVPSIICVLGGANAASDMGRELYRNLEYFTAVFSGEADIDFPSFVAATLKEGEPPIAGFHECSPIKELDVISRPDFSDYFMQIQGLARNVDFAEITGKLLPIETSRGCWWGAKHHCTFCGLNGKEMGYRVKSPQRIIDEIYSDIPRYGINVFQVTDNIMSHQFKRDVLPKLAASSVTVDMFFEVKSNLKSSELDDFVRAGILTIQPGIESLSSKVLARMNKGVTGIQNLWLLRECASRKIDVVWNLLLDMPDEEDGDYITHLGIIPYITHLQPPSGASRVVIDRFSPLHSTPARFGITGVTPLAAYDDLYPEFDLSKIAYHFTGEYTSAYRNNPVLRDELIAMVNKWCKAWTCESPVPRLYSVALGDGRFFVEDTRPDAEEQRFILDIDQSELLSKLCTPHKASQFTQTGTYQMLRRKRLVVELDTMAMSIVVQPEFGFNLRLEKLSTHGKFGVECDSKLNSQAGSANAPDKEQHYSANPKKVLQLDIKSHNQ